MEIQTLEVNKINPAVYNPRKDLKPGDLEYEKLKKSILAFDMVEPLVWNKRTGNLVGGHQRLKILKELGHTQVEVSVVDLDEVREKALNLALNKISGEWDFPKLKDLLEELDTGEFDIEITGFDFKEIEELMNQFHMQEEGLTDEDALPEAVKSISRRGDLWRLGNHYLLCGDATLRADIERLMGGEKADMVFTDPPYGIDLETDLTDMVGKFGRGNKYPKITGDDKPYDPSHIFRDFAQTPEIILWGADYYSELIPDKNDGCWFVWDKTESGISPNSAYDKMFGSNFELCWSRVKHKRQIFRALWKGIFGLSREDTKHRLHPTQKPVALLVQFIELFSKPEQLIVDIFGGSGSTLIACEKMGRQCYMMEIDEHYCDIIIQRWQDFTGKVAERSESTGIVRNCT